jgi:hypothetical protein
MEKKKQTMRFSDIELSLIKNTFADNEDLLIVLRKVFLQVKLTAKEQELVKGIFNKDMVKLIRKAYLPEVEVDAPINQVIDLWLTVDFKDKSEEETEKLVKIRAKLIELLESGLKRLGNPTNTSLIGYIEKFDPENNSIVELHARNALIVHQEQQLSQLKFLAGMKNETVEQTKERLMRDSSK